MSAVRDLTHTFRSGFPVAGYDAPQRAAVARLDVDGFRGNTWSLVEHSGTHVDAPSHFVPDGLDVSELRPENLIVPIAVIDIAERVAADPDSAVIVADLLRYEREHGPLPDGAAVFMRSDWDARVGDAQAFHGIDPDGGRRSPGFALETVDWLIAHRTVTCIGVDSPSIDVGSAAGFPVHRRWMGAARYAVECLAHLSSIPPAGATGFIGVVPFEAGTGGPCRVLATW